MNSFDISLEKLKSSEVFREWHKDNVGSYLSYGFLMEDKNVKEEWQIGYYNPEKDQLSSFSVADAVVKNPDSEMLKDNKKVLELDIKSVKIDVRDALRRAEKLQKEKYPQCSPLKKVILLQNLDIGQLWNITYVTMNFKTLNIKIDATNGNVLKYDLFDFFKIEK